MNPSLTIVRPNPSDLGRRRLLTRRGEPAFYSHWDRALMIHYAVDPTILQPCVPFELDAKEGQAWVSLVAFTMRGFTPSCGGRLAAQIFRPISSHEFLNVRTYVTHRGEPGIYFLAEWLPNPLSVLLGRPVFGLPYRLGELEYLHHHETGHLEGRIKNRRGHGALRYRAQVRADGAWRESEAGSLTEFLMERYSAFTYWRGWRRRFRVWHEPWIQTPTEVEILDDSLLRETGDWINHAHLVGANYSPGVSPVWMGAPETLSGK